MHVFALLSHCVCIALRALTLHCVALVSFIAVAIEQRGLLGRHHPNAADGASDDAGDGVDGDENADDGGGDGDGDGAAGGGECSAGDDGDCDEPRGW